MTSNSEDSIPQQIRVLEEKIDYIQHTIGGRIDKLFLQCDATNKISCTDQNAKNSLKDPYSSHSFLKFRYPYIRDFRNFSAPINNDIKQIQLLPTGREDVDRLLKQKAWSKEAKQQLKEAILEHYAKNHLVKLIQQKNQLLDSRNLSPEDVAQKIRLIEEQSEQVRTRNDPRIFVPEDRNDSQIDWCAISAKLHSYHHEANDCRLMWSNQMHWTINDSDWTKDEDICLINAVAKHGENDWDLIANELNTGRVAWQCSARYHREYASIQSSYHPGSAETERIIEVINLCRVGNFVPWNQVMYFIQFHNLHQVKHQWQRYLEQQDSGKGASTGAWSDQEDLLLIQAVAKYGEKDWSRIADCVPGRTNKSCRERYIHRARFPKRTVGCWRQYEDNKLLSLVSQIGTNWSLIVKHFPLRNEHQLRSRFELLKGLPQDALKRKGTIKHQKLYRSLNTGSVDYMKGPKRVKPDDEKEVDQKLHEIFSTYISKSLAPKKSLTYRSSQDEQIYQCLVETLSDTLLCVENQETNDHSNLEMIMRKAVDSCVFKSTGCDDSQQGSSTNSCILAPSKPTLQAYKAWSLQQDHLSQFESGKDEDEIRVEDIDERITKMVVGIFLLPAILSRVKAPVVDASAYQISSIIDKKSGNLYKIRNLQSNLLRKQ